MNTSSSSVKNSGKNYPHSNLKKFIHKLSFLCYLKFNTEMHGGKSVCNSLAVPATV